MIPQARQGRPRRDQAAAARISDEGGRTMKRGEPRHDPVVVALAVVIPLFCLGFWAAVAMFAIPALIALAMLLPTPVVLAGGLLAITWLLTGQVRG